MAVFLSLLLFAFVSTKLVSTPSTKEASRIRNKLMDKRQKGRKEDKNHCFVENN